MSRIVVDAEEIAEEIKKVASESISEEDLRQGVEYILKNKVVEKLKAIEDVEIPYGSWRPPKARYEVTLVSRARPDAIYGHLIIEYEKPKTFEIKSGFKKAVEQVKGYIRDHAKDEANFPRYFGVVLDGYKIGFVRYREAIKDFESKGLFEVNKNTIAKLIEAIIGLRRKALSAEELLKDFGPASSTAKKSIGTLCDKLSRSTPRTQMLFEDWRRVFSQVCAYNPEKIKGLEEVYGFVRGKADPEKLLFALHTYYALIMKLLAAEAASLYVAPKLWSYLKALDDAYYRGHEGLKEELKKLEEGGIFAKFGITNFMEADYFAWYLDEWDEQVAKCIMSIIKELSDYDPSAAELEPERVKDLFKRLYQDLVPKKIRHDLGEYYTPDWLAELVLNEVGWTLETFEKKAQESNNLLAPLELRLLDPACGSGTFLVLAIGRLRSYIEEHWVDKGVALKNITRNIVGFDLNPLAVIASRANYLIALGDMLREKGAEPIEIPVYLADSILVERRQTLTEATYILKTSVGEFSVPTSVVEKGLLTKVLTIIEECVEGNYNTNEFRARLLREVNLEEGEAFILTELFEALSKLEKEGKNRIWTRVLKNSFAPFFVGKFDYVVGNPPWVNWENLAEEIRPKLKELYREYDILPSNPNAQSKIDISMIFAYRCLDKYLKEYGNFGFLINDAAFKAMAGSGFRKFKVKTPFKVNIIHDLVVIKPFEGASNRTAMFTAKKGEVTEYPIEYVIWFKLFREEMPQNIALEEAVKILKQSILWAEPLGGYKPYGEVLPFLTFRRKDTFDKVKKFIGRSAYRAYGGADLYPAAVFRVRILGNIDEKTILVENLVESGRRAKVRKIQTTIEKDLVYPVLVGGVSRWQVKTETFGVIAHDSRTAYPIPESELKVKYPKTYTYFQNFREALLNRSDYKSYGKSKLPFYFVYKFATHVMSPIKVVWNRMGNKLDAAVVTPSVDPYLGTKPIVPGEVITFIPIESEDEAHYICSILNSSVTNLILQSIAKGGKNFATPEFINMINIRKYDPLNLLHKRLVELSKRAHQLVQQRQEDKLRRVEDEIDKTVARLYGLTDEELKEIKKCLAILEGREVEEEEEEVAELPPSVPSVSLRNNVAEEGKPFSIDVVVSNPLEETLREVSVKLKLFDGRLVERTFEEVTGEVSFPLNFDGLKAGEYKIKAIFEYVVGNIPKSVEKELTVYVKGSEVKHVERSFKPEDLLGA